MLCLICSQPGDPADDDTDVEEEGKPPKEKYILYIVGLRLM